MGQIVDRAFRLQGELEDVARQKDDLLRRVDLGPNRDALVEGVWNLMEGIASSIHEAKQEYDRERRAKHIGETFQQALDRQRRRQERAEALRGLAERHMAGADAKRWSKRELRLIGLSLTRSRGEWRRVDWEVAEAAISEARSARGFALHARSRLLDLRKKEYHPKSPKERAAIEKRPGGIDGAETRLFWAQQAHTIAKSELETAKKALRRAHEEGTPAERNAAEAAFWTALDQLEKAEDQARWEAKNLQNLEKGFERLVHAVDSAIQLVDEASSQVEKLALDLKRIVNGLGNKDAQDDASTRLIDARENLRKELERLVRLLKELENRTRPPDPEPAPPPPDQPPDKAGDPPPPPVTVYGPAIPPELCHLLAFEPACSSPFCKPCPTGTECTKCSKEYVSAPGDPGGFKGKGPSEGLTSAALQAGLETARGPGDWQPRENFHFAGEPPVRTPPDGAASGLGAAESAVAPFGSAPVPHYASPDESGATLGGKPPEAPATPPDSWVPQDWLNELQAWQGSRIEPQAGDLSTFLAPTSLLPPRNAIVPPGAPALSVSDPAALRGILQYFDDLKWQATFLESTGIESRVGILGGADVVSRGTVATVVIGGFDLLAGPPMGEEEIGVRERAIRSDALNREYLARVAPFAAKLMAEGRDLEADALLLQAHLGGTASDVVGDLSLLVGKVAVTGKVLLEGGGLLAAGAIRLGRLAIKAEDLARLEGVAKKLRDLSKVAEGEQEAYRAYQAGRQVVTAAGEGVFRGHWGRVAKLEEAVKDFATVVDRMSRVAEYSTVYVELRRQLASARGILAAATGKLGEEFVSFAEGLQKNTGKYLSQDVPGLKASFRVPDFVDVPSIGNGRVGRLVESKAGMAFDEIVKSERFLKDFMEQLEDYATIARHIAATREGTMELIIYFRECACVPEEILRRLRQMGYTVKRMP